MKSIMFPCMTCARLPKFDLDDWSRIERLFSPLPFWEFHQHWLKNRHERFQPARFRAARWEAALVVYGELWDRDIFNPATRLNEEAFTMGDVFEMFLRPEGQEAYFEFHVTPQNQKFQLRIPSSSALNRLRNQNGPDLLAPYKVYQPLFESHTRIREGQNKWEVVAAIPFASVVETEAAARAGRWRFSASRYDYTRGMVKPVISSTSPHAVADFHRQDEWGVLILSDA